LTEQVKVSRPDKVLFADGYTKADLVGYFEDVAEVMLPHLKGRALAFNRFPDGTSAKGFHQKQAPKNTPEFAETESLKSDNERGYVEHLLVNQLDDLRFLADQACLELHRWLSCAVRPEHPDLLVIDLDPPGRRDPTVLRKAVRTVAAMYEQLGLAPYLLATGGSGYRVVAPLDGSANFGQTRPVARGIADQLAEREPEVFTTEHRISQRGQRLFLDTNRNAYGQTVIAPYSPRARAGAPVAVPLDFAELSKTEPDAFDLRSVRNRLARKADPWSDIREHTVSIESAQDQLRSMADR
jgi:bifunctional non-homologous end joining protein LigD